MPGSIDGESGGLRPWTVAGAVIENAEGVLPVSYTHLRAHETPEHLVCRLLIEKKKQLTEEFISHQQEGT